MADPMNIREEEDLRESPLDTDPEREEKEQATKLKQARKGKLAHLTRRKNIILELMEDVTCFQEVKENHLKYIQLLNDFKAIHKAYQELLTENEANEDESDWFEPKMAEINVFLSSVSEWLTGASRAVEPQDVEVNPKDSVSQVSSSGSRSRVSSVASAKICAEAERAAILIKLAALKERHDLEEKEEALNKELQSLKKKREALELKTQLAASSSKLVVLMSAEEQQSAVLTSSTAKLQSEHQQPGLIVAPSAERQPIDATDAMNAYFAEMSMKSEESEFLSLSKVQNALSMAQTPSVRPKDGVHFQSVPEQSEKSSAVIKKTNSVQTSSPLNRREEEPPVTSNILKKESVPIQSSQDV